MASIVLHHGLFDGDYRYIRRIHFKGIDRALAERGHLTMLSMVHPTAGIERRAGQLKDWIIARRDQLGPGRIILLAHSLGGLDARYMLSRLGMAEHVSALVTLSTPHRGSPYADWMVKNIGRRLGVLNFLLRCHLDVRAIEDLTGARCAQFNREILDVPEVRYFSVSASQPWQRMPPFGLHSHRIVFRAEGENDGLVSVQSAQWGEHLETWPAHHWRVINSRFVPKFVSQGGDITPNYLRIVEKVLGKMDQAV